MKLFVINKQVLFYSEYVRHVDTGIIYKHLPFIWLKLLRMIHLRIRLPFYSIWYTREFRNIGKNDCNEVLLFDTILTIPAANFLRKKYPRMRIIYWFWNHLYNPSVLNHLKDGIECWSYDFEDCRKYKLKYNTQFYFSEFTHYNAWKYDTKYDCFFIGAEKGRGKYISQCLDLISKNGLSHFFVVSGNNRSERLKKWMPYREVMENIRSSRCIVDIVPDAQKGLTLRPLEALFMHKKLITNYQEIVNLDFYSSDNVYVIGIDDERDLFSFVRSDYNSSGDDLYIHKYNFTMWLKRFEKDDLI